jgi:broad specificity phosphatase PhoE
VILVRHGEGLWNTHFHNVRIDAAIPDPVLTETGRDQARRAADRLREHNASRLIASPYRRTLETAVIIAERLGLDIKVEPLVRERCAFSCDQGSPASVLAGLWPDLDFSGLDELWWGRRIESQASIERRSRTFAEAMARRADWPSTAVVSHWGFIRASTGRSLGNAELARWETSGRETAFARPEGQSNRGSNDDE